MYEPHSTSCGGLKAQAELASARLAWEQQREELNQRYEAGLAAVEHRLEQHYLAARAATSSTEQWKAKYVVHCAPRQSNMLSPLECWDLCPKLLHPIWSDLSGIVSSLSCNVLWWTGQPLPQLSKQS